MTVYDKIENIFNGYGDDRPVWAIDILQELKEIKELIKKNHNSTNKKLDTNYYAFIK